MQKWEYMFIGIYYKNSQYRVSSINGEEVNNWEKGVIASDHCNNLGELGWELVATVSSNDKWSHLIVFKRPKG